MPEQYMQQEIAAVPGSVVQTHRTGVVATPGDATLGRLERGRQVFWFLYALVCGVLMCRFFLLLAAANEGNPFAQLVLALSAPLVAPFKTLFGEPAVGRSMVDTAAVVGIVVYGLLTWALVKAYKLMAAPADPSGGSYEA